MITNNNANYYLSGLQLDKDNLDRYLLVSALEHNGTRVSALLLLQHYYLLAGASFATKSLPFGMCRRASQQNTHLGINANCIKIRDDKGKLTDPPFLSESKTTS